MKEYAQYIVGILYLVELKEIVGTILEATVVKRRMLKA